MAKAVIEPESDGQGDESDRRERAKRTLEACSAHVGDCLDRASTLLRDGTELAADLLRQDTPLEKSISDLTAFSINALSTFCCCEHDGVTGRPGIIFDERPDAGETIELQFDTRSETAGPLEFPTPAPLTWVDTTDLVGSAGTIASQRVLVRTFDASIMISLCDLRKVPSGVYEGRLTFTDPAGNVIALQLRAACLDDLWWAAAVVG